MNIIDDNVFSTSLFDFLIIQDIIKLESYHLLIENCLLYYGRYEFVANYLHVRDSSYITSLFHTSTGNNFNY